MIGDEEIAALYRCLLGRAPENADTMAAFRNYYPDFPSGRRAVLNSAEFARVAARDSGAGASAALARAFLRRAGGAAPQGGEDRAELARITRLMLRAHGKARLAVVAGGADAPVQALIPEADIAILHVAPECPAFVPQCSLLSPESGAVLFRVSFAPDDLAAFLGMLDLSVDVLAVLDGAGAWFRALQPVVAPEAILVHRAGGSAADAGPGWPGLEGPIALPDGLSAHHRGGWFVPVAYDAPDEAGEEAPPLPGLAVAAIVRNEEEAVVNMIRSILPVAGSVAILDTGSTDETVARAKAALDTCGRPSTVQRGASGRFDEMRNAALDLVDASAEWVLMLDADEELCREDRDALRALLRDATADAYALPRYNFQGLEKSASVTPYPDRQVRLLRCRTDKKVRYSGAVHETIRDVEVVRLPLDATAIGGARGGPHIHHLVRRFRSPEAEARKQEYYREIAAVHGAG